MCLSLFYFLWVNATWLVLMMLKFLSVVGWIVSPPKDAEVLAPQYLSVKFSWNIIFVDDQDEVIRMGPNPIWLCPYKKGEFGHLKTDALRENSAWGWRQIFQWCIHMSKNDKDCQQITKAKRHGINSLIQLSEVTNTADTLISYFYSTELFDNKLFSHPVCGALLWLH